MRVLSILVICAVLAATARCEIHVESGVSDVNITVEDYVNIVKGLLEGLCVKQDIKKVIECIDHVPAAVNVIINIMQKLKKIDFTKIREIVNMIIQVIGALKDVVEDIAPCMNGIEEFQKLIEKMSNISFTKILTNLAANVIYIIADVMSANKALTDGKYEDFGKSLGHMLYLILFND